MNDALFKNKTPNVEKLSLFGFLESQGADSFFYSYRTLIADGQFEMYVFISKDRTVSTRVIDSASNSDYVLHRIAGVCGAFVGKIKADYERVLQEIADQCFEPNVFKSDAAKNIIQHVRDTYQDELEFLWPRSPSSAILRRKDSGKWYAVFLIVAKKKLGVVSDEIIDIINLRINPGSGAPPVDHKIFFPGYHMNKKRWITIGLDDTCPIEKIYQRIEESYQLVGNNQRGNIKLSAPRANSLIFP